MAQAPGDTCYVESQEYRLCNPKNYDVAQKNPPLRGDLALSGEAGGLHDVIFDFVTGIVVHVIHVVVIFVVVIVVVDILAFFVFEVVIFVEVTFVFEVKERKPSG